MTDWTDEDRQAAFAEGWNVWDSDGSQNGPVQLCKLDDPLSLPELGYDEPKFAEDTDVWVLVRQKAGEGSELHQRALTFVAQHNSLEYARIVSWPTEIWLNDDGVFDPTEWGDIFPCGRCDGCGIGLFDGLPHDEEACVREEAARDGRPLSDYGR